MLRTLRRLLLLIIAIVALLPAQDTSAIVSGETRDSAGAGIPSANIELRLEETPRTIFSLQTDTEGEFKFTVLPAGTYTLVLEKPGFRTLTLKSIQVFSGEQKILPPLQTEGSASCGRGGPVVQHIELLPTEQHAGNLRGRIVRDEIHRIIHATVKLLCDERKVGGETKTDSNGEFIFFNLPARDGIIIRVTHPGYYSQEETGYEVRAGFDSTYSPLTMDRRLLSKRSLVVCE